MKSFLLKIASLAILLFSGSFKSQSYLSAECLTMPIWPTNNTAFFENKPLATYIQSTASGSPESGTFGFVRKNAHGGPQFHEGIDIKATCRNRKGQPQDTIRAILPGKVAYINRCPGRSSYGCYLVLIHEEGGISYYTLYAHLSKIDPRLAVNQSVAQGASLGTMGNTACYRIRLDLAHLHVEIGFSLGSCTSFQNWYAAQKFKTRNFHGTWNGMNLVGLDPLAFFRSKTGFLTFVQSEPVAFTLKIGCTQMVDFISRQPALLTKKVEAGRKLLGWQIDFNWLGLPLRWTPLYENAPAFNTVEVHSFNRETLKKKGCRKTLIFDNKGLPKIGKILDKQLKLLFNWKNFTLNPHEEVKKGRLKDLPTKK